MPRSSLILCLALAACGGGGDSPSVPPVASEAAGIVDDSFGDRGLFTLDAAIVPTPSTVREILPLEDGRMLVGGDGPYVLMLTPEGTLDPSFAANGIDATRRDTLHVFQSVVKVERYGSDRFIVVEFGIQPCSGGPCRPTATLPRLTTRRIDSRGQVDLAYGDQGSAVLAYTGGSVVASAGGRISVFDAANSGGNYLLVGSLDASGHHDTAFEQAAGDAVRSCGPRVTSGISSSSLMQRVSTAASGDKIVVAAQWWYPNQGGICITRLNADGTLDTSFGDAGHQVYVDADRATLTFLKVMVRADGKVVVVLANAPEATSAKGAAVLFMTSSGAKDTSVAAGGINTTPILLPSAVSDATLQPNGKPLASGYSSGGVPTLPVATSNPQITRSTPNMGVFDAGFGPFHGGFADLRVEAQAVQPQKIALDAYGRILVGGQLSATGRGAVVRLR